MDIRNLEQNNNLHIEKNISGSRLSFLSSGGVCNTVVYPRSIIQMIWVIDQLKSNYIILGNGSNTLISDRGIEDIIISTKRLNLITPNDTSILCLSGANIKSISRVALENNLSGLEKLSGIPGSIGGATYMNAGSYGVDIGGLIQYADVLIGDRVERLYNRDLGLNYRRSILMDNGGIVLAVNLSLVKSNKEDIMSEEAKYLFMRKSSQPEGKSLGSVFKAYNGIPAAKYIEELNIKGMRIGGAEISRKHCNFILNADNATTDDYIELAKFIQDKVREKFGITLVTEITYKGEANENIRRLSHPYDL